MSSATSSCLFCKRIKSNPDSFKKQDWKTNFCMEILGDKFYFTVCPECRDKYTFNQAIIIFVERGFKKL